MCKGTSLCRPPHGSRASMGSVVQGGLDGGDIEYHVIVAKKP